MLVDLCSLPVELVFLVTNKLYFHELCRLRRTCRNCDSFVEERRHRYTIRSGFRLSFNFDAIPDGSSIQDMDQAEMIVSQPSEIYLADPYSQLSAVYFDYIIICSYDSPMKSEKLRFPVGKLYERIDREEDEEILLRVIDLDLVNLLSRMHLRCTNFHFLPYQKEKNPWLYLSSVTFCNLVFCVDQEDLIVLTVEDLKRLATTKCRKIFSKFGHITEEIFNTLGAFTHICIERSFKETHGSTSWLNAFIEKLLAGETCGRLKELSISLHEEGIISNSWRNNPNFFELFKSEVLGIYLIFLPNNQIAFLREKFYGEANADLFIVLTDFENLWKCLQKFPCSLYGNRPIDFSPLVGNSVEQIIEKCQTFFQAH